MLEKLVHIGKSVKKHSAVVGISAAALFLTSSHVLFCGSKKNFKLDETDNKTSEVVMVYTDDLPTTNSHRNNHKSRKENSDYSVANTEQIFSDEEHPKDKTTSAPAEESFRHEEPLSFFDAGLSILSWLTQPLKESPHSSDKLSINVQKSEKLPTTNPLETLLDESYSSALSPGIDPLTNLPPSEPVLLRPAWGGIKERGMISGSSSSHGKSTACSWKLEDIASFAYDVPVSSISSKIIFSEERYDFIVNMPPGKEDEVKLYLRRALEDELGLIGEYSTEMSPVYILKQSKDRLLNLVPSESEQEESSSSFSTIQTEESKIVQHEVNNHDMNEIAKYFSDLKLLPHPVVNETFIEGRYNFVLDIDSNNYKNLAKSIEEQLGLTFSLEERPLTVLNLYSIP